MKDDEELQGMAIGFGEAHQHLNKFPREVLSTVCRHQPTTRAVHFVSNVVRILGFNVKVL